MDLELADKVAVVSAGSKGMGRECAIGLAREGARVALFSRDERNLAAVAAEIERATGQLPLVRTADLTDGPSVEAFFHEVRKRLGPVQILVANSAGPPPGRFEQHSDTAWLAAFEAAVLSTVRLVRTALPQMRQSGYGSVVAIQSTSVKQPIYDMVLSNGVRPGVAGLMKSLAQEYGAEGLRFNVVCPGRVMTERFLSVEASHGGSLEDRIAKLAAEVPLRRLGRPGEVADAVLFLCSSRASYITGSVVSVDGGNVRSLY
jgi:3-oxoacyl-[acyl-carrier protein] reductase